jgi:ribA/ribD-fused uncharacterized protein
MAEHWMMFQKALLFGDYEVAREVLEITDTGSSAMRDVKALGRKVRNFEEKKWVENRERIVYEGNMWKFRQNKDLRVSLEKTGESVIVEASPMDRYESLELHLSGKIITNGQNMGYRARGEIS